MGRLALILCVACACGDATPAAKSAEAEAAYTAAIEKCATEAPTRAAGEACIADVRKRWSKP